MLGWNIYLAFVTCSACILPVVINSPMLGCLRDLDLGHCQQLTAWATWILAAVGDSPMLRWSTYLAFIACNTSDLAVLMKSLMLGWSTYLASVACNTWILAMVSNSPMLGWSIYQAFIACVTSILNIVSKSPMLGWSILIWPS
eukprot:g75007.t1